jgi:cysteine-rich repeat protein
MGDPRLPLAGLKARSGLAQASSWRASLVVALCVVGPQTSRAELRITEILVNGTGSGDPDEWVEVTNLGGSEVALEDYRIGDEETPGSSAEGFFAFPATTLAPGETFIFTRSISSFNDVFDVPAGTKIFQAQTTTETGPNIAVKDTALASGTFVIHNTGDEIILLKRLSAGVYTVIDGVSYLTVGATSYTPPGGVPTTFIDRPINPIGPELTSLARISAGLDKDQADDWEILTVPTPGELPPAVCGNALVEQYETCDDGNDLPGDGCNEGCLAECGFACEGAGPFSCQIACGDGDLAGLEQCDDGNTSSGDGCDANCRVEIGYECNEFGACDGRDTVSGCVLDPCALPLRITEVHADGRFDPDSEWIEITNAGPTDVDLGLWGITDQEFGGIGDEGALTFPPGISLAPGASLILAYNAARFAQDFSLEASFEYGVDSASAAPFLSLPNDWAGDTRLFLDNREDEVLLLCDGFPRDFVRWGAPSFERIGAATTDYGTSPGATQPLTFERVLLEIHSGTASDWATSQCPSPGFAPNPDPTLSARSTLVTTAGAPVTFRLPIDEPQASVTLDKTGLAGTLEVVSADGLLRYTPPVSPSPLVTAFEYSTSDACATVGPFRVEIHVNPPACDPGQADLRITEVGVASRIEPDGDWVEITNPNDREVDLGFLRVGDEERTSGSEGLVTFWPGAMIGPGEALVVAASADIFRDDWGFIPQHEWDRDTDGFPNETPQALFGGSGAYGTIRLETEGDEVLLVGCEGQVIDAVYWGVEAAEAGVTRELGWARRLPAPSAWDGGVGTHTFERRDGEDTDTSDNWISQGCPTPGSPRVDAAAPVAEDSALPMVGSTLSGQFLGSDADTPILRFHGRASAGTLVIVDEASGEFTWTPPPQATGTYELVYEVSDGCQSDFGTVTVCIGGQVEVPGNATDEDCDGLTTCYADKDGDGYGSSETVIDADRDGCQSAGEAARAGDCDDSPVGCGATCAPGRAEVCDGRDNDCDAATADGAGDPGLGTACDSVVDGDLCADDRFGCSAAALACVNVTTGDEGRVEVCDPFDIDEDCDGGADDLDSQAPANRTLFYVDADGDSYGAGAGVARCDRPNGHATRAGDCADGPGGCAGACNPGLTEAIASSNCVDSFDNDCDGQTDTDPTCISDIRCYRDRDRDGFGDPTNQILLSGNDAAAGCAAWADGANPVGSWVADGTDCDDNPAGCGAACHPGLPDRCDGRNNDCSAATSDGSTDPDVGSPCDSPADADGCLDEVKVCSSGSLICPNVTTSDAQRVEVCDPSNVDEDCDGGADDLDPEANATGRTTFYVDQDGDGFGRTAAPVLRCDPGPGLSTRSGDCDDLPSACGAACRPGLTESGGTGNCADARDNDCDGFTDTDTECFGDILCYLDRDGDGYGRFSTETVVPATSLDGGCTTYSDGLNPLGSWVGNGLDCDDDPNACGDACHPNGIEICDGFDNDCLVTSIDGVEDPLAGAPCDSEEDADRCADDRQTCRSGAMLCVNAPGNDLAQIEVCDANQVDDDCDGGADDLDPDGSPNTAPRWFADVDEDGFGNPSTTLKRCIPPSGYVSNGLDCDDAPSGCGALCYPGRDDVCDGLDNDCNDTTEDGSADPLVGVTCDAVSDANRCFDDLALCIEGEILCTDRAAGDDGRIEVCDPLDVDEDCDGGADDDDPQGAPEGSSFYADRDGDGHGDPALVVNACDPGPGVAAVGDDCDDDTTKCGARCFPGRGETSAGGDCADGHDNDCDGLTDQGPMCVSGATCYGDADGDGYGDDAVTLELAAGLVPAGGCAAWDDGRNPVGFWVASGGDCDDDSDKVHPGAIETVGDEADEDCNGVYRCWVDQDDDGYARQDAIEADAPAGETCAEAVNLAALRGDCEDNPASCGAACSPANLEICDNLDNDCDFDVDEASDCDAPAIGVLNGGSGCSGSTPGFTALALIALLALRMRREAR